MDHLKHHRSHISDSRAKRLLQLTQEQRDEECPRLEEMARRAQEWVASPAGQQALAESLARAEKVVAEWREAQRVDWRDLHRPMTF